jgi:hypothetical protein
MATFLIYALLEPDSDNARYVGQTAQPLQLRLDDHLRVRGASARADWIRSLIARDLAPRIVQLDQVTGTRPDAYALETAWIRKLRANGHSLLNVP